MSRLTKNLSKSISRKTIIANPIILFIRGPAEKQVFEPAEDNEGDETYGALATEDTQHLSKLDKQIMENINKATLGKITPRLAWPTRSVKPVSEYGDDKIFCLAFPCLYPGGSGTSMKRGENR